MLGVLGYLFAGMLTVELTRMISNSVRPALKAYLILVFFWPVTALLALALGFLALVDLFFNSFKEPKHD